MIRISTLFYHVKKMVGAQKEFEANVFIKRALNQEFSPSDKILKNIKAFSDAYYYSKSDSGIGIDTVLN